MCFMNWKIFFQKALAMGQVVVCRMLSTRRHPILQQMEGASGWRLRTSMPRWRSLRQMTDPKYKSAGENGREHGAVALRVEAL